MIDHISEDFGDLKGVGSKSGRTGLEKLLKDRGVRAVSFADWQSLEDAEHARATHPAPRQKFTDVDDMIDHLDRPTS